MFWRSNQEKLHILALLPSYPALVVKGDIKGGELVKRVPVEDVGEEVVGEEGAEVSLHVQDRQV